MPGVMVNDRIDQDAVSSAVLAVLNNALDAFTATRAREGERSPACSSTTASKLKKS